MDALAAQTLGIASVDPLGIGIGVAAGAVAAVLCGRLLGIRLVASARAESSRFLEGAARDAESSAQKAELDAERRIADRRAKAESELESVSAEVREQERRLAKRQGQLDRDAAAHESHAKKLAGEVQQLEASKKSHRQREDELSALLGQQRTELLRITGLTAEEAKEVLLSRVEEESRFEAARVSRAITEQAESKAKEAAREITVMAIQRYASEHTAESTVRAVPIPSDELKGRVIGREGRNIRALERVTGADLIVDDTPGVIVVSCFDKVRQAVAAESLSRLVNDGRIHPTRIEEVVSTVRKEVEQGVVKYGTDAVLEANLRKVHPKISKAMGRLHYRTSYGQNVLRHSMEVAYLSQIIADQLGMNGRLARRCGFLHDIGKAMDHEHEGGHPKIGMDFAKQYGESEAVLNAIGGHHGDIPSTTFYTPIVMAADAVSGARPGARRESLERYIQRLHQLQDIALGHKGVNEAYAIQAGREVRVMVDAKRVGDDEAHLIAKQIAQKVSDEMTFPGEVRVTVLRETRAIEIAR